MGALSLTIAVLTYRRPDDLRELLPKLDSQLGRLPASFGRVEVLVVDNDPDGGAREVVTADICRRLRYVNEKRPGIAAARNRAMDESVDSDLLVFIDDDESPSDGWLNGLVRTQAKSGAAAVAGSVVAKYAVDPDPWLVAGKFFVRARHATGAAVPAAGAGNLLLDLRQIRPVGLRFDDRFGLTGGEDTLFTSSLVRVGLSLVWCDEAEVTDIVPARRLTRRWALWRAFSHGNTAALIDLELSRTRKPFARSATLWGGVLRTVGGTARAALGILLRSQWHQARGARAACRGIGMAVGSFGLSFHEYARLDDGDHGSWRRIRRFAPRQLTIRPARVRVLLSFPPTKPKGNPYRALLERSIRSQPGVSVRNFRWRTALFDRYDVFHVHWPEILISSGSPWKARLKQALFALFLFRLRLTRIAVVETIHNTALPQGLSMVQLRLLASLRRKVKLCIRLNDHTAVPPGAAVETIVHGHYRDWFVGYRSRPAVRGRVAFVGLVRRYKNVIGLIEAFHQTAVEGRDLSLHVVGSPSTDDLRQDLETLAAHDPRVELRLTFVEDDDLVAEVQDAELIVLPYHEMHNSAGVLTALSLDRPVLVPDNEVNRDLADEVGGVWVQTYGGHLTGEDILRALQVTRDTLSDGAPNLDRRGWDAAGADHAAAYREARALRGSGSGGS